MVDLKLINGDLVIDGQNDLSLVSGDDEFLQCLYDILKTNLTEWFLNPAHGFDRFQALGQKPFDRELTIQMVYDAILQEPRVERIEDVALDFDRPNRELNISFAIVKTTGETVEGEVTV